jgi:hypothetical protein
VQKQKCSGQRAYGIALISALLGGWGIPPREGIMLKIQSDRKRCKEFEKDCKIDVLLLESDHFP